MVTVTATQDLEYHGKAIAAGEQFQVEPTDALVLRQKRQVDLTVRHTKPAAAPAPKPKAPPDPPVVPMETTEMEGEAPRESASARRRRHRSYRRSDITEPDTTDLQADGPAAE